MNDLFDQQNEVPQPVGPAMPSVEIAAQVAEPEVVDAPCKPITPTAQVEQVTMFDLDEFASWKDEWRQMPEFVQKNLEPWKQIVVSFESEADMKKFAQLIGQPLTYRTRSVWYPEAQIGRMTDKMYIDVTAIETDGDEP